MQGKTHETLPWCSLRSFSSSKSVCRIVGGATLTGAFSSCSGGWILCSAVIFKRGMMLVGTTPSMHDGRRITCGVSGGLAGSADSIGDEELRVVSFRDPVPDGLESLDLKLPPPPPPLPRFFLKLKWRLIQLPLGFSHLLRARMSGSLLHFSRVRMKVFFRKYFLLCTYLEIASAHPCLPVKRAHSSAHKPRPWSLLFGLAPARKTQRSAVAVGRRVSFWSEFWSLNNAFQQRPSWDDTPCKI